MSGCFYGCDHCMLGTGHPGPTAPPPDAREASGDPDAGPAPGHQADGTCTRCGQPVGPDGLCPDATPPLVEEGDPPECAVRPFSSRVCVLGTLACESDHGTCRVCGRADREHVCGGCGEWDCRCSCYLLEDPEPTGGEG